MTEEKNTNLTHHIWEGSVGVRLQPQKRQDGTYFWKYSLTRAFKRENSEEFEYASDFSDRNDEALMSILGKAASFRSENDPNQWVQSKLAA